MTRILNFGSLNIDHVFRVDTFVQPGETKTTKSQSVNPGGKGLNQSIALARAGAGVLHAGLLGRDGGILRDALSESGVDLSLLRSSDALSGSAVIEVADDGQNRILLYGGSNRLLTEDQIRESLDTLEPGDIVLLQNETNLVGEIIREAAGRGLRPILNAAPADASILRYPLNELSWLIVNEIEGALIAGCDEPSDIFETLCARYPDSGILLTLGSEGSMCRGFGKKLRIGVCPVHPVDTTAAGDCFIGYFLHGLTSGLSIEQTLRLSTAASALCIQSEGASGSIPSLREVREAFDALVVPEVSEL